MARLYQLTVYSAATAADTTGVTIGLNGVYLSHKIQYTMSGTATVKIESSVDGSNWKTEKSATATGVLDLSGPFKQLRISIPSYTSGNVDVTYSGNSEGGGVSPSSPTFTGTLSVNTGTVAVYSDGTNDTIQVYDSGATKRTYVDQTGRLTAYGVDGTPAAKTSKFRHSQIALGSASISGTANVNTDNYVLFRVDTTGGAATLTLLTPASNVLNVAIVADHLGNAGTNNITITPQGGKTVNGAANYVISTNYGSVMLIYDGTNWIAR